MAKRKTIKRHRRYSEEEKAAALAALAANDGNLQRTARQLGIPRPTLRKWSQGAIAPEVLQKEHQKKGPLADGFESIAWALLDAVTPALLASIETKHIKDVVIAACAAADKVQLLRGKPTSIGLHDFAGLTDEQLDEQLAATESALAGPPRRKTTPHPAGEGANEPG